MADRTDVDRYVENLVEERRTAVLYRQLAEVEADPNLSNVYRQLAETEDRHASLWEERIRTAAGPQAVPTIGMDWRTRTIAWLARRFGASAVLPIVMAGEKDADASYLNQPEAVAAGLPAQERTHFRVFRSMASGGLAGSSLAQLEGRHRAVGGNALRAAVLGANDGLVSNLSLVMGVAGATLESGPVLVAGFAGLLAGALSMALGEWLSVQSARELFARQIAIEKAELEASPEEEAEELALIYQAKGIPRDQAEQLAASIVQSPEIALDTLAREELSIDPDDLGGSAWVAAATSFLLFAVGAIIPLIGFLVASGFAAVMLSAALSAVGLFVIGAGITLFTGRSVLFSGSRQVLFGLVAAAITFGLGKAVGTGLGI